MTEPLTCKPCRKQQNPVNLTKRSPQHTAADTTTTGTTTMHTTMEATRTAVRNASYQDDNGAMLKAYRPGPSEFPPAAAMLQEALLHPTGCTGHSTPGGLQPHKPAAAFRTEPADAAATPGGCQATAVHDKWWCDAWFPALLHALAF